MNAAQEMPTSPQKEPPRETRAGAAVRICICYLLAIAAGGLSLTLLPAQASEWHPMWQLLVADLVATVVVFMFSVAHGNASFYDPYWSVVPPAIGLWILVEHAADQGIFLRQWLALGLVSVWAYRLTWNWWRGWTGLDHEDWRYGMLRSQTGRFYPLVNLGGIHVFPTLQVFLGCLPLWVVMTSDRPMGWLDTVAVLLTGGAIWLEARADSELHAFRNGPREPGQILDHGTWAWSRHPNYLGEMSFWIGLSLMGIASGGGFWLCCSGALAIALMFVVVSVPMLDKRSVERRPEYAEYMRRIPALLPWFPSRRSGSEGDPS